MFGLGGLGLVGQGGIAAQTSSDSEEVFPPPSN